MEDCIVRKAGGLKIPAGEWHLHPDFACHRHFRLLGRYAGRRHDPPRRRHGPHCPALGKFHHPPHESDAACGQGPLRDHRCGRHQRARLLRAGGKGGRQHAHLPTRCEGRHARRQTGDEEQPRHRHGRVTIRRHTSQFGFDPAPNRGQGQPVRQLMNHSVKLAALAASLLWISCSPAPGPAPETPRILPAGAMNDPLEPLNRGLWVANRGLLAGILQPAGRVWRTLVPTPARESIQNFNRNVRYPGRVANQMLQGRWQDAGDESLRFLANTTAGVGGLFDVASKWDMPKSNADFGQTFTRWGWRPGTYLMLPVFGPSDECHALGTAADRFADPLNYSEPYSYISAGTSFNRLSESTDEVLRLIRSSADPYADTRILWTHAVAPGTPDMRLRGPVDMPTLQTLGISLIRCKDRDFPLRGREMSVRVPATGRTAPFNVWLQKQPAPLVYINPGLGGHRLSLTQLSLAEFLYQNGFSVVVTSSVFHPEFMERAATTGLPAYPPADSADLLALLAAIDARLERRHPGLLGPRALVGFSMGGFHALNLAAREKNHPAGSPRFERYVAINPPVDLHRGISALDRFVNAPAAWPENEREARIDNTFLKVAHFARQQPSELAAPPLE
ncbi:MAG: hypothetical protein EHM17_15885, partial [Verrucomicrobiaceae bacterium]